MGGPVDDDLGGAEVEEGGDLVGEHVLVASDEAID